MTVNVDFSLAYVLGDQSMNMTEEDTPSYWEDYYSITFEFPAHRIPKQRTQTDWDYNQRMKVTKRYWQDDEEEYYIKSNVSFADLFEKLETGYRKYMKRAGEVKLLQTKRKDAEKKEEAKDKK